MKIAITQCTKNVQKKAEYQRQLSELFGAKFTPNADGKEWEIGELRIANISEILDETPLRINYISLREIELE